MTVTPNLTGVKVKFVASRDEAELLVYSVAAPLLSTLKVFDAGQNAAAIPVYDVGQPRRYATPIYQVYGSVAPPLPTPPPSGFPPVTTGLLLNLQADALALADGDPVSTWANAGSAGGAFTATGAGRPTKQTASGGACLVLDGVGNFMTASAPINAAFNGQTSFTVFTVCKSTVVAPYPGPLLTKINNDGCFDPGSTGLGLSPNAIHLLQDSLNEIVCGNVDTPNPGTALTRVATYEVISLTELHAYQNGVIYAPGQVIFGAGCTDWSNSEPVRIGVEGDSGACDGFGLYPELYAIMVYAPALSPADRAAMEAALMAKYGI